MICHFATTLNKWVSTWFGIADDEDVIRFCLEISNEVVKKLRVRSKICWNSYAQNFHCSHGSPFPFSLLKDRKIRHDCTRLSRTVWRCCGCRGIIHVTESDPLMDVSHSLSVLQVDVIGLYRHAKWLTEPGNWMCTRKHPKCFRFALSPTLGWSRSNSVCFGIFSVTTLLAIGREGSKRSV